MKTIRLLIFMLSLAGVTHADDGVHRVKILKLESEIQQTPRFQVAGVKEKRFDPRYWLEIEAELEVETTGKSKYIPEIRAQWFAVVMDKASRKAVRLDGEVDFVDVRTKDKKIYISAYISPDVLEKLTGERRPGENDIEGVALKISGNGIVSDGKHGRGLVKATAKEKAQWWEKWNNKTLSGAVLAKSKTPFAPLWTDRYPSEKSGR